MKRRSSKLEDISIQAPCPASWEEMEGGEARRHCDQCDLHVHNLAALPRAEGESLLAAQKQGQKICVRVEYLPSGECITADTPQIVRTGPGRLAAAALALGMSLAACNSSGTPEEFQEQPIEDEPCELQLLGSIALHAPENEAPPELIGDVAIPEDQLRLLGEVVADCEEEPSVTLGTPGPPVAEDD